jgi:hypothetical protein
MLFKNSVRTSKRTPHITITKINWLTLFTEIIAVYCEYRMKPINPKCRSDDVSVRAGRTYAYRVCVWRESGVSRFCVGAFGRNLASDAVKMFSLFIYFIKNFINIVLSMRFANIPLQYKL